MAQACHFSSSLTGPFRNELFSVVLRDESVVWQFGKRIDGTAIGAVANRLHQRSHAQTPFGRRRLRDIRIPVSGTNSLHRRCASAKPDQENLSSCLLYTSDAADE